MKKSKFLALSLALVMAGSLMACGTTPPASSAASAPDTADAPSTDGAITVAFSQCGNQNNWKVSQTNDMKAIIEGAGYNYIYTDAQDDTAKQVSDIEDIISQKPDYLVLSPREQEGYQSVLDKAAAASIPVILVDRGCSGNVLTLNCGDFVWEGNTVATYLLEQFGDKPCNVVELTGTPGSSVAADRAKGFAETIADHDNVKVIASQVGNFSRSESQKAMENMIQAYGSEIDAVYAHNDDNAIGAIQAIKAAGMKPGEDIKVYSIDGQKDALQAIIDGDLECSVLCSPLFGESVLKIIDMVESDQEVPTFFPNPGKLYTIDNAEACLSEAY